VPIVPSAMLSWDFVRDRAIRNLQIENPLHAILSGWFVEPENCGSPASPFGTFDQCLLPN